MSWHKYILQHEIGTIKLQSINREQKLEKLCIALGVSNVTDPDKTYELTSDNMQKMLAINMKFR